jgi:hypothetical protein
MYRAVFSLFILGGALLIAACKGQGFLQPTPTSTQVATPTPHPVIITECVPVCAIYPVKTWEDLNKDGIYRDDEPPLPGVLVHLEVTPIGDYYTSVEKTDQNGSSLLCFGDASCNTEMQSDVSIEVVANAPEGCEFTTLSNLPEKPEQMVNHWNEPDEPYTFGFWCGGE